MASLGDVSTYLRQRRAIGKPITAKDRSAAWSAYFDTESNKALDRSRLDLQKQSLALSEKQTDANISNNSALLDLRRQESEDAKGAAKISGITQLGGLGVQFSNTDIGKKAISGITDFGKRIATGVQGDITKSLAQPYLGGSEYMTPATQAVGSLGSSAGTASAISGGSDLAAIGVESSTASTASTGIAGGLASVGVGLAAGFVADKILGSKVKEAGGITSGAATGFMVGGPVGAVVGGVLGGLAKVVSKGSWVCTKTKEMVGISEADWETIGEFRKYVFKTHPDWINAYVKIGPSLIESINGDDVFYKKLKQSFIVPIVNLVNGGFNEAAYLTYKSVILQLIEQYNPALAEESPGGE